MAATYFSREDFNKFLSDFKKRHENKTPREYITVLQAGATNTTYSIDEKYFVYLTKEHVAERTEIELYGNKFTIEVPLVKYVYWSTEAPQQKAFYERVK